MPVLIVVFSVGAFALGRALKGSDTIVNTIAIVRGAAGAESGLGQVYVGVFSPSRRTFDVRVGGGALLSNPISIQQQGVGGAPLDILLGDPAVVRGYDVGFGSLRGFRAEAALPVPKVDGHPEAARGTTRGHRHQCARTRPSRTPRWSMAAASRSSASSPPAHRPRSAWRSAPARRSVPASAIGCSASTPAATTDRDRTIATRRAVIDQLTQYNGRFSTLVGAATGQAPVLVGWQPGGSPLTVEHRRRGRDARR